MVIVSVIVARKKPVDNRLKEDANDKKREALRCELNQACNAEQDTKIKSRKFDRLGDSIPPCKIIDGEI